MLRIKYPLPIKELIPFFVFICMKSSILPFLIINTLCLASCQAASSNLQTPASQQAVSAYSSSASMNGSSRALTFPYPISIGKNRITKKTLGTYVTPASSPIQPEKFTGFHTGLDFETFPNEQSIDIPINAVCEGKVLFTGHVNGYGGVMIQSCTYKGEAVTILYGHLRQSTISVKKNDPIKVGDRIAVLGKGFSAETDGERKHLHLGIHTGNSIEYRGYVKNENELSEWIDPFDHNF